ncbi:hypothetical protein [Ammoniphilus resinae]|uniref:Peptidase M10 metallopeptidase domain-containing protein n=1 Tax=Ammoniphilus resinae TaxID=861532 RepID=A0ABS4GQI8_9BACL|nr:hypothetical protein [Ammoniphilus resinae]MBP1932412.1 hypothetical protein [Ammoniphilus resinae]
MPVKSIIATAVALGLMFLFLFAPWLTSENIHKIVENDLKKRNGEIIDYGVSMNCDGCGVKQVKNNAFGKDVVIEYIAGGGPLPPNTKFERRQIEIFVSFLGTVHELGHLY